MYDLIGDIHGHADELEDLLTGMGYRRRDGVLRHPDRQAVFVGDFVDRGPRIRQVLETVRPMVESGAALAVMGNHELDALAYHTEHPRRPGEHLRRRNDKNTHQHAATLAQLRPDELRSHLDWFRTLPLWLDLDGVRVVHACWSPRSLSAVEQGLARDGGVTDAFLAAACDPEGDLFGPVETLLKGKESRLPDGRTFLDKDGHARHAIRTRWYLPAKGQTYRTYALQADPVDCDEPLTAATERQTEPYPVDAPPVFVGHYWLAAERPAVLAPNVACLDYSVAKGGYLCAYRWNGERTLSDANFVWAGRNRG